MSSLPRKSPSQERSKRTVERILDAAAHVFHEHGYADTTTNDVADRADVSIGSLYQYFPNKDALLVALTRRHIEATTVALADLLAELPMPSDLDGILRAVVDFLVEQHDLDDLHLLVMHSAPRTIEINQELEQARSRLVDLASELLASVISDLCQRALIARMVVATIDAAVHDVIIRHPRGRERKMAIDLAISTALGIIDSARRG